MSRAVIRRLQLTDVRSYAEAAVDFDGRPVALFGPNGAGKTNLLEAISLLAPGAGLRGAKAGEVARREPGAPAGRSWSVFAAVERQDAADDLWVRLGAGLAPGATRRSVRLEGEATTPGRLAEHLRLVWLTPAHDRLFLEAASERRRFLDRLVLAAEPTHAGHAAAYDKVMAERTRVLTDARDAGRAPDPAWLDALEHRMALAGEGVAAARARTVHALSAEIARRGDRPFPTADLALSGEWAPVDADYAPRLHSALGAGRERDAGAGRALVGPHRCDLLVTLREKNRPASEGSTGEQKALLLNLVLAQASRLSSPGGRAAERGAESPPNPILLLDEVAAHLDPIRRAALFDEIAALGLQAFMTGVDESLFAGLGCRAQHISVEAGRLTPTNGR